MKKLTRWLALLLALLTLTGCSALREDNDITGLDIPEKQYEETGTSTRQISPALYYLSVDGAKLSVETRELTVGHQADEAEEIVAALLDMPRSSELRKIASGLSLDKVIRTGDVINAYLYSSAVLTQERRFIVSAAVTNTLVDYFDVPYVCVFINGDPLTVDGYPYGGMQKISENVRDAYHEYQAKCEAQNSLEISLPIYFLDETRQYILPEMRTVRVEKNEENAREQLIGTLLAELSAGPKIQYNLTTSLAQQSDESDRVRIEADEQLGFLQLRFSYNPSAEGEILGQQVCAALYFTLASAVPSVTRLTVAYGLNDTGISRSVAQTFLGDRISLYLPNEDKSALVTVSRTVSSDTTYRYNTFVRELMRGPLETDREDALACFPESVVLSDFNYIRILGNTAYVDFGEAFAEKVSQMDEESEYMMYYSVVNTLCSVPRIRQVQFTLEDQVVDSTGGKISIGYPLLPNPGLLN